jgi:hypothetical protein
MNRRNFFARLAAWTLAPLALIRGERTEEPLDIEEIKADVEDISGICSVARGPPLGVIERVQWCTGVGRWAVTLTKESWAPGCWVGMEGAKLCHDGTPRPRILESVDLKRRRLYFDYTVGAAAMKPGDGLYFVDTTS